MWRKNGEGIDSAWDKNGGKRGGKVRNYDRQLFSLDRAEKLKAEAGGKGENRSYWKLIKRGQRLRDPRNVVRQFQRVSAISVSSNLLPIRFTHVLRFLPKLLPAETLKRNVNVTLTVT